MSEDNETSYLGIGELLSIACYEGDDNAANFLIRNGAKAYVPDRFGDPPLIMACRSNSPSTIDIIICAGGKTDVPNYISDPTTYPLHLTCQTGLELATERVLYWGADPDVRKDGDTPLMLACQSNSPDSVRSLLLYGANANLINYKGETAMDIAVRNGFLRCVEVLEQKGDIEYYVTRVIRSLISFFDPVERR